MSSRLISELFDGVQDGLFVSIRSYSHCFSLCQSQPPQTRTAPPTIQQHPICQSLAQHAVSVIFQRTFVLLMIITWILLNLIDFHPHSVSIQITWHTLVFFPPTLSVQGLLSHSSCSWVTSRPLWSSNPSGGATRYKIHSKCPQSVKGKRFGVLQVLWERGLVQVS